MIIRKRVTRAFIAQNTYRYEFELSEKKGNQKKLNDRMTPKRTKTMNQGTNIVSRIDNNKYSER